MSSKSYEVDEILIVPQGTFFNDKFYVEEQSLTSDNLKSIDVYLKSIYYGFIESGHPNGHWHYPGTINVEYQRSANMSVTVKIPGDIRRSDRRYQLAYIMTFSPRCINYSGGLESYQTETRYISIHDYDPSANVKFVKLPILNYAVHPWKDSQYVIHVDNFFTKENLNSVVFPGKIKTIYYGFINMDADEYVKSDNKDIPWINSCGDFKSEGIIDITAQQHHYTGDTSSSNGSSSGKGYFVMNDQWVRIPDINNFKLVWKIGFEKWAGRPWELPSYEGYHETQTFYFKKMSTYRPSVKFDRSTIDYSDKNKSTYIKLNGQRTA